MIKREKLLQEIIGIAVIMIINRARMRLCSTINSASIRELRGCFMKYGRYLLSPQIKSAALQYRNR